MTDIVPPPDEVSLVFAGLPHTGKTSYLALVYIALGLERKCRLRLGTYKDDREYLNEISARLLRCEPAIHTEMESWGSMSLSVLMPDGHTARVCVPDLSGETWEHALTDRAWSQELDDAIRASVGTCVFLHVGEVDASPTIADADRAEHALTGDVRNKQQTAAHERRTATQVQVVDLLQLVVEERAPQPAKVSVILSAWDLEKTTVTPADWLRENCPLLDQYLRVNSPWLGASVFGVSAQGGRFDQPADQKRLRDEDVLDRASVTLGDGSVADIDAPLLWALGTHD